MKVSRRGANQDTKVLNVRNTPKSFLVYFRAHGHVRTHVARCPHARFWHLHALRAILHTHADRLSGVPVAFLSAFCVGCQARRYLPVRTSAGGSSNQGGWMGRNIHAAALGDSCRRVGRFMPLHRLMRRAAFLGVEGWTVEGHAHALPASPHSPGVRHLVHCPGMYADRRG